MTDHTKKPSAKQDIVIEALLAGSTRKEAAAKAGISIRTLTRWMACDEFAGRLRSARREILDRTVDFLASMSIVAAKILTKTMLDKDTSPGVKVRAAVAILTQCRDIEMAEMQEQIERLAKEMEQHI